MTGYFAATTGRHWVGGGLEPLSPLVASKHQRGQTAMEDRVWFAIAVSVGLLVTMLLDRLALAG